MLKIPISRLIPIEYDLADLDRTQKLGSSHPVNKEKAQQQLIKPCNKLKSRRIALKVEKFRKN